MIPIRYLVGDATRPDVMGLKIIAHCCNNAGLWGAGFVMALSRRWKAPFAVFDKAHSEKRDLLGSFQLAPVETDIIVCNIIGQHGTSWDDMGNPPVRYEALRKGFHDLAEQIRSLIKPTPSVHMPRLGCGLAGGQWHIVEKIIQEELSARDIAVFVYDLPPRSD